MNTEEIKKEIHTALVSVLKHEDFEMRESLVATEVDGWDSLSHMLIITKIEERFGIRFKLRDLNKLKNMGSLIEVVESKL